jgi:hypothetical protein
MATWRLVKPWQILMVLGWLTAAAVLSISRLSNNAKLALFLIPFAVICVSIVALTNITMRHYRCPKCDAVPRGGKGVLLDPWECPSCGVPLK